MTNMAAVLADNVATWVNSAQVSARKTTGQKAHPHTHPHNMATGRFGPHSGHSTARAADTSGSSSDVMSTIPIDIWPIHHRLGMLMNCFGLVRCRPRGNGVAGHGQVGNHFPHPMSPWPRTTSPLDVASTLTDGCHQPASTSVKILEPRPLLATHCRSSLRTLYIQVGIVTLAFSLQFNYRGRSCPVTSIGRLGQRISLFHSKFRLDSLAFSQIGSRPPIWLNIRCRTTDACQYLSVWWNT